MKNISALMEIFPIVQKLLLNTIDLHSITLTRAQILILFVLSGKDSLNMSQIATYLASSKEQATRAVAPLVKEGYVSRFHKENNRKKVYICLTEKGANFIHQEKQLIRSRLSDQFNALSLDDQMTFQTAVDDILHILKKLDYQNIQGDKK